MLLQELPFLGYYKSSEQYALQMSQSTLDCAQSYMLASRMTYGFLPAGSSSLLNSPSLPASAELPKEKVGFQPYNHQSQLIRPNLTPTPKRHNLLGVSQPLPDPNSGT